MWDNQDLTSPQMAPAYGFAMAFLRAAYRGKRWKARFIEASMLAIVMLGVVPVLQWLGLPQNLAIAVAGWAGYVGVDALAEMITRRMGGK